MTLTLPTAPPVRGSLASPPLDGEAGEREGGRRAGGWGRSLRARPPPWPLEGVLGGVSAAGGTRRQSCKRTCEVEAKVFCWCQGPISCGQSPMSP